MFGKKINLKGFKKKPSAPRSKEGIDREYADHAIQVGHATRVISQMTKEMEGIQQDIEKRVARMEELNKEILAIPADKPTEEPKESP